VAGVGPAGFGHQPNGRLSTKPTSGILPVLPLAESWEAGRVETGPVLAGAREQSKWPHHWHGPRRGFVPLLPAFGWLVIGISPCTARKPGSANASSAAAPTPAGVKVSGRWTPGRRLRTASTARAVGQPGKHFGASLYQVHLRSRPQLHFACCGQSAAGHPLRAVVQTRRIGAARCWQRVTITPV
jgi:hypothetical protein